MRKRIISLLQILALVIGILGLTTIQADAAQKSSKKKMTVVYGDDGTVYHPGDTIPMSNIKKAKYKLTNMTSKDDYMVCTVSSVGAYYMAEDPEPNFGYSDIVMDKKRKEFRNAIKELGAQKIYDRNQKIPVGFVSSSTSKSADSPQNTVYEWDSFTIEIQPVTYDKNGKYGPYKESKTYIENVYHVDRNK